MGFDAKQLLDLIPLAVGAMKPGSPEAAAFMRGYQRSQQQLHQQGLQDRQFQRQDDLAQAQIGNLTADNQRADQQMQNQSAQLALNRLTSYRNENQKFMTAVNTAPESVVSPQTDPLQAQNALTVERLQAQQQYGVPAGTPQGPLPDMTQAVTKSKAKLAQTLYQQAEKEFGAAAMAADSITIQTGPDKFGDVKPSALRAMFAPQATTASGAPASPIVKDPEASSAGSFDAQFGDVLASEEEKLGRPLTRQEKADLRLKSKTAYDKTNDRPATEPRQRFNVQPITNQDGTTGLVRINMDTGETTPVDLPQGAGSGRASDTMRLSGAYLTRTKASDTTAKTFEAGLLKLGPQFAARLPNLLTTPEGQQYRQAENEFINAALRRESGAAIQPSEYTRFEKIYFVMPGDTAETIAQKQAARQRVIDGFQTAAGNLGGPAAPPATSGGLPPGVTVTKIK